MGFNKSSGYIAEDAVKVEGDQSTQTTLTVARKDEKSHKSEEQSRQDFECNEVDQERGS